MLSGDVVWVSFCCHALGNNWSEVYVFILLMCPKSDTCVSCPYGFYLAYDFFFFFFF